MLHIPGYHRARSGHGTGRPSVVLILTGLMLVVAPVLRASASSCAAKAGCSSAKTGDAGTTPKTGHAGTTAKTGHAGTTAKTGHAGTTAKTGSVGSGAPPAASASPPAQANHVADPPAPHNGQAHDPRPVTQSAGSGSTQHQSGGGHRHSHAGASSKGATGGSATTPEILPRAVIGRLAPPAASLGEASLDGTEAVPAVVVPRRSPRVRMTDGSGAAEAAARVAGALRFPAVLLVVILLFLVLQQRADRLDPKLANAPVGRRQETLEFR